MIIRVLGPGCAKCEKLYNETKQALASVDVEAELVKVDKIDEIVGYGVLLTPALVIDDKVLFSGKVPGAKEIARMIEGAARG